MQRISRSKLHRALQNLSTQRLDNVVVFKLLDRYRKGNPAAQFDRSLVLISGSFIEQGLKSVIKLAVVREYDHPLQYAELFGGDRPGALNGFYGKIILGHAIGAYTQAFKEDLDRVRHIRNAFAHSKGEISFKTKELEDSCHFNTTDHFSNEQGMVFKNARDRYVFMAFFAVLTFELIIKDIGEENRPDSYKSDQALP